MIPALDSMKVSGRKLVVVLHFAAKIIVVERMRFCLQVN